MMHKPTLLSLLLSSLMIFPLCAQDLMTNIQARNTTSLNGPWQYIVDPYETGFYDYRFKEKNEGDPGAYWNSGIPWDKTAMLEHGYDDKNTLNVPGDWNSQDPMFLYYEGTVWYKKSFDYQKSKNSNRLFLYFGAVNYQAEVYLNGKKLGSHKGGFTPFQFELSNDILKDKNNRLVVKVDNKRHKDEVPTVNTDWWNYGGITRDVLLIETPEAFVEDYFFELTTPTDKLKPVTRKAEIAGWVTLNGAQNADQVTIEIPELKLKKSFPYEGEKTAFEFSTSKLELWSDTNPKRYEVIVSSGQDEIIDKIGFRKIEVSGKEILLNGESVFLRGICLHEEMAEEVRRATSKEDALKLFGWAQELNCNFVRLAHYPHNEYMVRTADSLGILLWEEIPVYWTIDFGNPEVLGKAKAQLEEMITRDRNRASTIIWSVGNETPVSETRTEFMSELVKTAKELDDTRLISAALEVHYNEGVNTIDDPLGAYTDIVSVNEYLGWYVGLPNHCQTAKWETAYDKPMMISETGGGAKQGFHGDSLTRWSEEYQEWLYKEQVEMMKRMPDNYTGLAPWILVDFRSPKRNNPTYQEGWNRKGLISNDGKKKKAFFVLKQYYEEMK
jgi:beta-glucuronidase